MTISRHQAGFSLVELIVVVAIIGVLSVIAYPSYQDFIRKGNRADVMAQLVELTMEMEQYRFENQTYLGAAEGGADIGAPDSSKLMGLDSKVLKNYTVTISAATRDSYMLRAIPKGAQSEDDCGTITIGLNGDFNYAPLDGTPAPDSCEK
jgi:type IV pilus assembly protein PilE